MGGNVVNKFSHPKTCNDVNEVRTTTKHDDIEESSPSKSFIGCEKGVVHVVNYTREFLP